ncbi:hypothetical protein [Pseudomonas caspiana]|uniref:hypothetical protein n=1 Tax=Pseudomonas caspiana TaxID=1451454 RepID=UPI0032EC0831
MHTQSITASTLVTPSITKVLDSKEELSNPGQTEDTLLTLSGTADPSTVVSLYDGLIRVRTASVTELGEWAISSVQTPIGSHSFTILARGVASSPPWLITVGTVELDLEKPAVAQAPGGILDPVNGINGATVVVTYAMLTTDTVELGWNGLDNLVLPQPGSALGSVTFTVPASAVAAVIGKTIPVLYTVTRNGVAKPSEVLNLTVHTLAESVLEAPKITQAADSLNLDVNALTGDAELRVKPWPFIGVGQRVSLRFEGTKADGTAYNWPHPTWQNLPITSTGEPSTTVALANLKELKDESSLRLVFEVSFDEGSTKVAFPVRTYTVKTFMPVFEVTSVKTAQGEEVLEGSLLYMSDLILTGTAAPGEQVDILDGVNVKGTTPVDTNGNWIFSLPNLTPSQHSLWAIGRYDGNPESRTVNFEFVNTYEDFELHPPIHPFPVGRSLEYPTMTFTCLGPLVYIGPMLSPGNYYAGNVLFCNQYNLANPVDQIRLRLRVPVSSVEFGCYSPKLVFKCFDSSDAQILLTRPAKYHGYTKLSVPGKKIQSIILVGMTESYSFVDNFRLAM